MRQLVIAFGLFIINNIVLSQISTTNIAWATDTLDNRTYDSTENYLGKGVLRYVGQELYLKGKSVQLREYGYSNFLIDYQKFSFDKGNIYKQGDGYYNNKNSSKYDELVDEYFKVLQVINPDSNKLKFGDKFFLKLQAKSNNDIVYYQYDARFENSFPFIVVGFYDKRKQTLIGKTFRIPNRLTREHRDINTGKLIRDFSDFSGQKWKCTDLTIEEKYYELAVVLENDINEKIAISFIEIPYTMLKHLMVD